MNLNFGRQAERFREEARDWLEGRLSGEWRDARGRGGPGDEEGCFEIRRAWELELGRSGYIGLEWPRSVGGRELSFVEHVVWHEEYVRARAPGRLGHIGEMLLGPTMLAFGTEAQKQRILPPLLRGEALWCQGYSEPDAGSDLASVRTTAILTPQGWSITGQKVWTSHAQWADFCFVLCRTQLDAQRHAALSYLLVPMKQPGVTVRPIRQLTGTSEFNEVFFDGALTSEDNVVGAPGEGWRVAMGTLAFERGASTLGQQLNFETELSGLIATARERGLFADDEMRRRIARAAMGLRLMRLNFLRFSSQAEGRGAFVAKLFWSELHKKQGELALEVLGLGAELTLENGLTPVQRASLFARADTIYAGSSEIQRNLIAERALGLPREPRR